MKKILACIALLAGAFHILSAVPAYPGKIRVTQPDGSVISIRLHGDEWLHYATDEKGQVVARGKDGFYRQAQKPTQAQFREAARMRSAARQMRLQQAAEVPSLTRGTHRIPVVLVSFSGNDFVIDDPRTAFSDMLNKEGYSDHGGTGSVRDYYYENSHGAYTPVFEVFGPVKLDNASAYYAGDSGTDNVGAAVYEACSKLDGEIDFSRYDSDGDGHVDMILMYFAGHNQAESQESGQIWPHQSSLSRSTRYDGKRLGPYFCTSELRGAYGNQMCGIGTTSHEFGHSLGLPDFYDTDYEDNGSAGALYSYSIMCEGSYNNNGRTPPYFNSEELKILGWMEDQTEITAQGEVTLEPVQSGAACRTATSNDGEYYVYECRTKTGWDRYLPGEGLLVYHVDKSRTALTYTDVWGQRLTLPAADLWDRNDLNCIGEHPCFYLIPSSAPRSLNYRGSDADIPFPGPETVRKYVPLDWEGEETDFKLSDIAFDGSRVTMTVGYSNLSGISGTVRNTSVKPLRGAVVSVYPDAEASQAPVRTAVRRTKGAPLFTATTEADGSYRIEDASLADGVFLVTVTCEGYVRAEARVTVGRRVSTRDFYLRKEGESEESTFRCYDPASSSFTSVGYGESGSNLAAGILISPEALAAHEGKQLKLISFQLPDEEGATADAVYVFVEAAGRRVFTQQVADPKFGEMNTVNVTGEEYFIPSGQVRDFYIGYGLVNASSEYPLLAQECPEDQMGYIGTFSLTRATGWDGISFSDGTTCTPVLSATVGEKVLPELGFNHIANPGNGTYSAGDRFDLSLVRYEDDAPSSVSWRFDGQPVPSGAVTLTAGKHTVEALLTYPDGTAEVIRLVLTAD